MPPKHGDRWRPTGFGGIPQWINRGENHQQILTWGELQDLAILFKCLYNIILIYVGFVF